MTSSADGPAPVGVYLHLPFCRARCTYCAFYTVGYRTQDAVDFIPALCREVRTVGDHGRRLPEGRAAAEHGTRVNTVYLGGGTPSLLPVAALAGVLAALRQVFDIMDDAEITLEANPETVHDGAGAWLDLGINRVSLGAQTFDPGVLMRLGRRHLPATIEAAAASLRRAGCANLNMDLIAGVSPATIEDDLDRACALQPEHLSVYLLETDEDELRSPTALSRRNTDGRYTAPEPDWFADAYGRIVERLAGSGLRRYEICNFAVEQLQCRHNLKYWQCQDVLGFGPGAHSLRRGVRFSLVASLDDYMQAFRRGELPPVEIDAVDSATAAAERLILALRLDEGVDIDAGGAGEPAPRAILEDMRTSGLVQMTNRRLRLTERGILLSNEVFQRLLPDVPAP